MSWSPETKLRTSLPFIIHQADLMAARIEFEREWLDKLNGTPVAAPKPVVAQSYNKKPQVNVDSLPQSGLKDIVSNFFND
jgi:hypothetical protein